MKKISGTKNMFIRYCKNNAMVGIGQYEIYFEQGKQWEEDTQEHAEQFAKGYETAEDKDTYCVWWIENRGY